MAAAREHEASRYHRQQTAEKLRREGASQLKSSLAALKRDVAASIRLCSRDFGVLGKELVCALQQRQKREQATRSALEHERKRRRKLQHQVADLQGNIRVLCRVRPALHEHEQQDQRGDAHQQQLEQSDVSGSDSNSPKTKQMRVQVASQQELRVCSAPDGALYKSFSFYRIFDEESTQVRGVCCSCIRVDTNHMASL